MRLVPPPERLAVGHIAQRATPPGSWTCSRPLGHIRASGSAQRRSAFKFTTANQLDVESVAEVLSLNDRAASQPMKGFPAVAAAYAAWHAREVFRAPARVA